jgi:hypothetical protein
VVMIHDRLVVEAQALFRGGGYLRRLLGHFTRSVRDRAGTSFELLVLVDAQVNDHAGAVLAAFPSTTSRGSCET